MNKNSIKSICLISGSSPEFLGGVSLYQRNLIEYSKQNKLDLKFTWLYAGKENKKYSLNEIKCIEFKVPNLPLLKEFFMSKKVKLFLEKNNFDIINSHANWGSFLRSYNKKEGQKMIHTYHGVTCPYMKIQFAKFGFFKYFFYPLLPLFYLIEKPPMKKADKIICVSEKVKKGLEELYQYNKNLDVIRTGVNFPNFKKLSKEKSRKNLSLEKEKIYGLYSGRGGYWNKGLDRAINIGKEIYNKNKKFRLIVVGADKKKCKKYLKEKFIIYKGVVDREKISEYYSAADFFFFLSRSEGGAPALALSEAIASECLVICSKDSEPEIIRNEKEGLIIEKFGEENAKKILKLLLNKIKLNKIKKYAKNKIKNLSLKKWGGKYFLEILK